MMNKTAALCLVVGLVMALPACHHPSSASSSEPSGSSAVRPATNAQAAASGRPASDHPSSARPTSPAVTATVLTAAQTWSFEDVTAGQLPAGWQVEATNQRGPLATWRVIEDDSAPSGPHVLALTSPNHTFGGTFNICWTDAVSFLDGEIEVRFKAVSGHEDQGGGVIWRVQDEGNYYISRFNPLENNFRIYYVRDGARRTLEDISITLPAHEWHTLRIVQRGNHFEGYLDGRKLLEGSDDLFQNAGGVGVWTKADAVTSFDDFTVRP